MQKHKLIYYLSQLDRKEMTRFCDFVHSPYFNKHEGVRHLVDYLNGQYPKFSAKNLRKEQLMDWFKATPNFSAQKLALLFTYSVRLLEQFIGQIFLAEENNFTNKNIIIQGLRQKNWHGLLEKTLSKVDLEPQIKGSQFHQQRYFLAAEINDYYSQFPSAANHQFLVEKQHQLDLFFMCEKLKDACEMYLRKQILKVPFELRMLEEILTKIDENPADYEQVPTISMYSNIYKLLTLKTLKQYEWVLKKLATHEPFLPKTELENIYNYLQNFCIQKINEGDGHFLTELFKIYQSQLAKELLLQNGFLAEFHYKNIVTTGLRERAFTWVYDFIQTFKSKLNPITAENAYSYNLANYFYFTQQYEEVLPLLIKVEYTDVRYNLDSKTLLLRTYFELEEEEALLSLTDAFRQYLRRNRQVSEEHKKGYLNLLKYTKKVFRAKMDAPFMKKEQAAKNFKKIKTAIEEEGLIFNKNWLLEKISTNT